jgi:glycosyltransferase involved in cell wall biosynthesis
MSSQPKLVVIETHPVQYHAPVYSAVQQKFCIPVTVIYGSDFSVAGYRDQEFKTFFAWDTDLLSGYDSVFLSRVQDGGSTTADNISATGLAKTLDCVKDSVILLPGYSGSFYRSALYRLWSRKNPLLFRAETTDHARVRSPLKSWLRDRTLERLYARCAKVLYIGQHSYNHLTRLGCRPDKLVFSPYCVDISPFQCDEDARSSLRDSARAALGVQEGDIVVLFSGKLIPRKAPNLIIEAIKLLPEHQRRSFVIVFMGDGELRDRILEIGKSEPSVRMCVIGFQNQKNLSPYFHASDLLVLPSIRSETWGLVVNEALHHGVPCVVSEAVGAAPDLIHSNSTGAVCRTGSASSLAEAITTMLPLLKRLETRQACRKAVISYVVDEAARGIATAFHSALSKGASA